VTKPKTLEEDVREFLDYVPMYESKEGIVSNLTCGEFMYNSVWEHNYYVPDPFEKVANNLGFVSAKMVELNLCMSGEKAMAPGIMGYSATDLFVFSRPDLSDREHVYVLHSGEILYPTKMRVFKATKPKKAVRVDGKIKLMG
jgi:hypothetical protein